MTSRQPKVRTQLGKTAVQLFAANERMNQLLIEALDPAGWTARAPGGARSIAAIFTHLHNVRSKWVRLTAPHLGVPALLNRAHCTPREASEGLAESAARCIEMLAEALGGGGQITHFLRDGWARRLPAGPDMLFYILAHEAHHRGQVCMLADQLGFPLPTDLSSGLWNHEKPGKATPGSGLAGGDLEEMLTGRVRPK
jgi:uncharacterized damage-inducible protein DinB